ncbi:MAG TPA: UDP-N-acetylglucosamine 4,6-dehydratase (inverting) [Sphingobacteriaceae bacterium]|nr:UDP-N-acetylglucosamine 4,6-dehydratase (inverting) [Sphingobacteriaceae bacterium]
MSLSNGNFMPENGIRHFLKDKTILVTGGTGSFGHAFARAVLRYPIRKLIILSRDEMKQYEMSQLFPGEARIRFFIGDVRDERRLHRAFNGVDYVIHAAAMKQVPAAEYNPFEAVKTNIHGAQNVIEAALDQKVQRVIALSTDKASSPINLYGATKLASDKLFIAGNAYAGSQDTRFAVVRYGNVVGSRGSVVPLFQRLAATGVLPITDPRMTRFWITLEQGVNFVLRCLQSMHGGELFVPKIPSMRVVDLARAIAPDARLDVVGIRPGEKLHEEMISVDDARRTVDMGDHYVVQPELPGLAKGTLTGRPVPDDFRFASDTNHWWLTVADLRRLLNLDGSAAGHVDQWEYAGRMG